MSFAPFINFLNAPLIQPSSNKDMFANMLRHYEMAQEPERLARQQRIQAMDEKYQEPLLQAKLQEAQSRAQTYSPQALAMKEALMKAQIETEQAKAKSYSEGGRYAPSNIQKKLNEYYRAVEEEGEDSPRAMALARDINKSTRTETSSVATGNYQRDLAGKEYDYLQDIEMPVNYLGAGGESAFVMDVAKYKNGDKEAGNRIESALVNQRLLPETATMMYRMANTKQPTVKELEHQKKTITSGWPRWFNTMANNVPQELVQRANKEYRKRQIGFKDVGEEYQSEYEKSKSTLKKADAKEKSAAKQFGEVLNNQASQMSDEELLSIIGGS